MSLGPLYVFLGEVSVQVLCPFFNWVVCLPGMQLNEFFLYFGDQTLVQDIISKYIFTSGWFPFHFADVFFTCAEAFYFDEVLFVNLPFMSLALGDISAKILLCGISEIFLSIFSSRTFMISQLIFKSFVHLVFIFVYGVSWGVKFLLHFLCCFFFFACSCPDLLIPFVEEAIFTPFYASFPFVEY